MKISTRKTSPAVRKTRLNIISNLWSGNSLTVKEIIRLAHKHENGQVYLALKWGQESGYVEAATKTMEIKGVVQEVKCYKLTDRGLRLTRRHGKFMRAAVGWGWASSV